MPMAEAVGLTLSTIAIASLFTTCLELIDTFELSKSYECDYDMACLKLSLQRVRLDLWGDELNIRQAHLQHQRWEDRQDVKDVISCSLLGIKHIFSDAEGLKTKYSLIPHKASQLSALITKQGKLPSPTPHSVHTSKHSPRPFQLIRRKTTWAIRDKQKFDNLIKELDFLITNLERVRDRLEMENGNLGSSTRPIEIDSDEDEDVQMSISAQPILPKMELDLVHAGTLIDGRRNPSKEARHLVSTKDRKQGATTAIAGNEFGIGSQSNQALVLQGQNDVDKIIPAAKNQINSFFVDSVNDNATTIQGFNSQQTIESALSKHYMMIAHQHKAEAQPSRYGRLKSKK